MEHIKDRVTPENRVTVVLRAKDGRSLDGVRQHLYVGKTAASDLEIEAVVDGDARDRLEALDDPASPIHSAVALLEHAADKFEAGGDEKAAKPYRLVADQIRQIIRVPKPGLLGVDALSPCRSDSTSDRAQDLLLVVERAARRVIQRELAGGGLISRAIQEVRP